MSKIKKSKKNTNDEKLKENDDVLYVKSSKFIEILSNKKFI